MTEAFTVRSGGAVLAGEIGGQGSGLALLHAGVADRRMWQDTLARRAADHRVLAYDRRGFGETVTPDEPFRHIDDLDSVIGQLPAGRVRLVGCSQGGRIAIDYALARPERVAALALVATAVSGAASPDEFPPDIEATLEALEEAENRNDIDRVNALEAQLWLDGPQSPEGRVGGAVRQLFHDMNGRALRHPALNQEIDCPPAIDRLEEIRVPTCVIWGDLDFPHLQERSRQIAARIAGARAVVMPGCAHLPNLEQPERFDAALAAFLAIVA